MRPFKTPVALAAAALTAASLTAVSLTMLAGVPAFADDGVEIAKTIKMVMRMDGGLNDIHAIDADDMEIGEIREFEAGDKQIVVRRDVDGFEVEIDGETIDSASSEHRIIHIRKGDDTNIDIDELQLGDGISLRDADVEILRLGGGKGAAHHLEESGVLDGLSSSERDDILETLRGYDNRQVSAVDRAVFIRVEDEEEQ